MVRSRKPLRLRKGDGIAIFAPAGPVDGKKLSRGVARLAAAGYVPEISGGVLREEGYLAGDDAHRAAQTTWALSLPEARAAMAARGGCGGSRALPPSPPCAGGPAAVLPSPPGTVSPRGMRGRIIPCRSACGRGSTPAGGCTSSSRRWPVDDPPYGRTGPFREGGRIAEGWGPPKGVHGGRPPRGQGRGSRVPRRSRGGAPLVRLRHRVAHQAAGRIPVLRVGPGGKNCTGGEAPGRLSRQDLRPGSRGNPVPSPSFPYLRVSRL